MKGFISLQDLYRQVQLTPPTFAKNKVKLNIQVVKRNGNRGYIRQEDFDKLLQKYWPRTPTNESKQNEVEQWAIPKKSSSNTDNVQLAQSTKVEQLEKVLDGKERMLVKMNETVGILKKVKEELQSEKQERMEKCNHLQTENKELVAKVHHNQLRVLHFKWLAWVLLGLLLVCGGVIWRVLG